MNNTDDSKKTFEAPGYLRRKLLIEPRFQIWFIAYTAGIALTISIIFYAAISFFFKTFHEKGQDLGLPSNHIFFIFLKEQRESMDYIFAITVLAAFIVTFLYGLLASNRIAGPLYRLKMYLRDWSNGDRAKELKFRHKDHFKELADVVNDCLKKKT